MEVVECLRKVVRYAYCQAEALGVSKDVFEKIATEYKKLMQMRAWRELGDRQNAKILKATKDIRQQLEKIHLLNIEAYDTVLNAKKNRSMQFLQASPATAQTALMRQRVKKAERRAVVAENAARMAQQEAAAARQAAINAEAEALEAQRKADAANRRRNNECWH